jgi:hypothetical protein
MFGRLLFFILVLALLFAAWKTGVLESVCSGGVPEYGRECTVEGPVRAKGVPAAIDPETLAREIDTHVGGASSERLALAMGVQSLFDSGALAVVNDGSRVKVVENGSLTVQSMPYKTVKVRVLNGELKGQQLWIERVNLIDTPVQTLFQSLRRQQSGAAAPAPAEPTGNQREAQ